MNWVLLIVAGIIIVSGAIGYCRGIIQTVFSLVSIILSLVLTAFISPIIADTVSSNEKVNNFLYTTLKENLNISENISKTEDYEPNVEEIVETLKIPEQLKEDVVEYVQKNVEGKLTVPVIEEKIYSYLMEVIINMMVYILTFIAVSAVLVFVVKVLNIVGKLPVIKELNKILGLGGGIVIGICLVYVLFIVIMAFANTPLGEDAIRCINENEILLWIHENNPVWNWVMNNIK